MMDFLESDDYKSINSLSVYNISAYEDLTPRYMEFIWKVAPKINIAFSISKMMISTEQFSTILNAWSHVKRIGVYSCLFIDDTESLKLDPNAKFNISELEMNGCIK